MSTYCLTPRKFHALVDCSVIDFGYGFTNILGPYWYEYYSTMRMIQTRIYPRSWALIIITSTNKPLVMMMMHVIIWRYGCVYRGAVMMCVTVMCNVSSLHTKRKRITFMTRALGLRQLKKRKHSNIHKRYHNVYSTKSPRYNIIYIGSLHTLLESFYLSN